MMSPPGSHGLGADALTVTPPVPPLHFHDCGPAVAASVPVRVSGVVLREAIDVLEVRIRVDVDHPADDGNVPIPRLSVEHGQRDSRVAAHVFETYAACVHVEQDRTVVAPLI